MRLLKSISVFAMFFLLSFFFAFLISNFLFQTKAIGVMTRESAITLGLVEAKDVKGAFGPKTIMFAPIETTYGTYYEYRSVWPIVGALAGFNTASQKWVGNGVTGKDIVAYCRQHDSECSIANS